MSDEISKYHKKGMLGFDDGEKLEDYKDYSLNEKLKVVANPNDIPNSYRKYLELREES